MGECEVENMLERKGDNAERDGEREAALEGEKSQRESEREKITRVHIDDSLIARTNFFFQASNALVDWIRFVCLNCFHALSVSTFFVTSMSGYLVSPLLAHYRDLTL